MKVEEKYLIYLKLLGTMLRQYVNEGSCDTGGLWKGAEGVRCKKTVLSYSVSQGSFWMGSS